jgi:SAM-dependent methyltransferase
MALAHVTAEPVLEIGFGTGDLLIEMVQRGLQVCGLELSPAMQRITARKMRRRGVWAPRLRADAQAMPFAGASLGAIVATFPAAYILAPTTWQEAARVLRPPDPAAGTPGGRLIVAGLLVEAGGTLLRRVAQFTHGGLPERTVAQLQRLAEANGFGLTVVREQTRWLRSPVLVLERTEPREGSEAPASDTPRGRAAGPLRREVVDT